MNVWLCRKVHTQSFTFRYNAKACSFCKEMRSPSICAVNWSTVAVETEVAAAAALTIEQVLEYETWTPILAQSDRHVHIKFHVKTLLSSTNNDPFNKQNRDSYQPMTMKMKMKKNWSQPNALFIATFCTTFCGCVLCFHIGSKTELNNHQPLQFAIYSHQPN